MDPKLLLESLLSKLFPFLKDLFIVSASSSAAAALLLLPLPSTATKRPSNPRLSPRPPSESSHFHFHRGSGDHSPLRRTRARRTWRTRRDWARQTAMNTSNDAQKPATTAALLGFLTLFPDFPALKVGLLFLPCSIVSVTTETAVAATATLFLPSFPLPLED